MKMEKSLEELEEQYEGAIHVTAKTNAMLDEYDSDSERRHLREVMVANLQGTLNMLRGFDSVAMGC